MAKCRNVRLGDVVKIQQTTCAFGGDSVWLLNLDMVEQNTGKIIDYYYTNQCGNSTIAFDENHVLYSKLRPNLNKVVCPNRKGFATSELLPLLPDNTVLTKEYLAEYLRSPFFVNWAVSKTAGAKMPRLAPKDLLNKSIPLPPLETQNQIAANLDKVTHTIDLCNAILEKLDLLVKSRFVEMFGDTPDEEKVAMADICRIITDGTHQPPKFVSEGIPFLFVSNIVTNEIQYDAQKFISKETYAELIKRTPIAIGDILLSTVGSYGHPAVVKTEKTFCFQRHIAYLKPNADMVDSEYLHGAILSADVQRQIDEGVKGIAQKTLNLSEIRKIKLPLPPIKLQQQFAAFVEQTDKSKSAVKQVLEKAETLKKALMQEYFG